jgi:hypothetical protein
MNEILVAFGRGLVKTLISFFVGTGVGLVTFGASVNGTEDVWMRHGPPPELFLAIGAGMLSTAASMVGLFFIPRLARAVNPGLEKGEPVDV